MNPRAFFSIYRNKPENEYNLIVSGTDQNKKVIWAIDNAFAFKGHKIGASKSILPNFDELELDKSIFPSKQFKQLLKHYDKEKVFEEVDDFFEICDTLRTEHELSKVINIVPDHWNIKDGYIDTVERYLFSQERLKKLKIRIIEHLKKIIS